MKFKILLYSSLALFVAACTYLAIPVAENNAAYSPRSLNETATSYLDAIPYYQLLRGNLETGQIEPSDWQNMFNLVSTHDRVTEGNRETGLAWYEMGPDNVGGRTRGILALADNTTIFAGSVSGGLWKSTNAGNSWSKVESFPVCPIGSIDQTINGYIYVGTGNQFESSSGGDGGSGFIGNGLYYSMDSGATWQIVDGTETNPFSNSDSWRFVNDVAADPTNPNRIWIAGSDGVGYWEPGLSEPNMDMDGLPNSGGQDLEWAVDGSYLLVGIGAAKVYRSTDGGSTFTELEDGIPSSSGRVRLSISPDDVNVCYAGYSTSGGSMGGLYASQNKGEGFSTVWPAENDAPLYDPFGDNNQGYYDFAQIVKAGDPGTVFVGGVTLWKSGLDTQPEMIAGGLGDTYVHPDIHTFEFASNGDLYIGCDGGVFKSTDGGVHFTAVNFGYNVTQFYGIAHSGGYPVMGGAQDNGTTLIPGLESPFYSVLTDQQGIGIGGGDGFDCDMSSVTTGQIAVFLCSQFGHTQRYDQFGSGGSFYDDDIIELLPESEDIGPFYTVFRLFEDTEDEDSQQYIIYENQEDFDISDTTISVLTLNQGIPVQYTLGEDDVLHYWEELVQPEITTNEPLTEDPNYWFLPVQLPDSTYTICDSIQVGTETVIDEIIPITETIYWEDSIFYNEEWIYVIDSTIVTLDYDTTYMEVPVLELDTCLTYYHYDEVTLFEVHEKIKFLDTYTSMFVTGFYGADGVWITREALNLNTTPDWWRLGDAPASGVRTFEFSADGDHLFYSSWGGTLYRYSGLDDMWSSDDAFNLDLKTILSNAGGVITGIASDPNNPNHMVITIGGYGTISGGHVRESWNALSDDPEWDDIWQWSGEFVDLEKMPCYTAVINTQISDGSGIAVGTEFGVYYTDNGGTSWTHCLDKTASSIGTVGCCPVFDLRQQTVDGKRFMNTTNWGSIYAGTHGRGIFRADDFLANDIADFGDGQVQDQLIVFPNPTNAEAYLNLNLGSATDVSLDVYDATGKLVRSSKVGKLAEGTHKISLEAERLAKGNYVVHVDAGQASGVAKFIKTE